MRRWSATSERSSGSGRLSGLEFEAIEIGALRPSILLNVRSRGVLDKVVGIGKIARPFRQPAAGPPLERLEMPSEQALHCPGPPIPRAARGTAGPSRRRRGGRPRRALATPLRPYRRTVSDWTAAPQPQLPRTPIVPLEREQGTRGQPVWVESPGLLVEHPLDLVARRSTSRPPTKSGERASGPCRRPGNPAAARARRLSVTAALRREFATDGVRFYFTLAQDESGAWMVTLR